jgi:hypothetical protein
VPGRAARRPSRIDEFLTKLEDLADQPKGKVRADVAHNKITAMRFAGSELTTRRAVAVIKGRGGQDGGGCTSPDQSPGCGHSPCR